MKQQPKPASPAPVFSDWSFVELLGKRRRAGVAEAVDWHGVAMLRIRIPSARENFHFATEEFYNLEKAVFALRVATQEQVMDALFPLPKPEPRKCPECRNPQPRFDNDGYLWCEECNYDPEKRHYHALCGKSHGSRGYCSYDDRIEQDAEDEDAVARALADDDLDETALAMSVAADLAYDSARERASR